MSELPNIWRLRAGALLLVVGGGAWTLATGIPTILLLGLSVLLATEGIAFGITGMPLALVLATFSIPGLALVRTGWRLFRGEFHEVSAAHGGATFLYQFVGGASVVLTGAVAPIALMDFASLSMLVPSVVLGCAALSMRAMAQWMQGLPRRRDWWEWCESTLPGPVGLR